MWKIIFSTFLSWLARATGSTDEEKDADAKKDLTEYAAFLLDMVKNDFFLSFSLFLFLASLF